MPGRIGLFGGSFDPIHTAHLVIASLLSQEFGLEKLYFIPNYASPFKINNNVSDIHHRLKMIELAIKDSHEFELCTFEADMKRAVYTYETVDHFMKICTGKELNLILGYDSLINFKKWKNFQHILDNVKIIVAGRPDTSCNSTDFQVSHSLSRICPLMDISSTQIRKMAAEKIDIKYLVIDEVRDYIKDNGLYH